MAKIHEEIVVIKLSKLVKDSDAGTEIAGDDIAFYVSLLAIATTLSGSSAPVQQSTCPSCGEASLCVLTCRRSQAMLSRSHSHFTSAALAAYWASVAGSAAAFPYGAIATCSIPTERELHSLACQAVSLMSTS